jgi:hypothetical protein
MYGSHSFDNIYCKFDSFLEQYKISKKIYKVITDNGSNIKKAFRDLSVLNEAYDYESFDEESSDESDNLSESSQSTDSSNLDLNVNSIDDNISIVVPSGNNLLKLLPVDNGLIDKLTEEIERVNSVERFGCAGHNIQLAVNESLKDKNIESILIKVSKFIAKSKNSNLISDELRKVNKFLHKNNKTRWNSTFTMITSYLKLSNCEIIKALSFSTNKKNQLAQKKLILSSQEYEKLKELQIILKDVFIFTELIQGDNVTISRLIPAVNTVLFNLRELKNINHLNSMRNKLIQGKQMLFIIKKN